MKPEKRGRRSGASLTVVGSASPVETIVRPHPPTEYILSDDECAEWWAIVNENPADWFPRSSHAQLAQYCRHVVSARRVSQVKAAIEVDPDLDLREYDLVLKMQDRETKALASIGTKLRITPQSLTNHRGNKTQSTVKKPWEA